MSRYRDQSLKTEYNRIRFERREVERDYTKECERHARELRKYIDRMEKLNKEMDKVAEQLGLEE